MVRSMMLHRVHGGLLVALVLGCSAPVEGTSTSATDAATGTEGATDGTASEATPTEGGQVCVPGKVEACPCVGGGQGVQACEPDGGGYGPCDCPDATGGLSGEATSDEPADTTDADATTSSTGDATTDVTDATETTASEGESTGEPPVLCEDPDDAPMLEGEALAVEDQDCFGMPKMFAGVLAGDADVDWFTYHGECFQEPEVLHSLEASGDVRLCVFLDCDMGEPSFVCGDGAQANMSPGGLPGCCDDVSISFGLNCMGGGENAQVYVRLDMADAAACVDYTVEYEYNDGF